MRFASSSASLILAASLVACGNGSATDAADAGSPGDARDDRADDSAIPFDGLDAAFDTSLDAQIDSPALDAFDAIDVSPLDVATVDAFDAAPLDTQDVFIPPADASYWIPYGHGPCNAFIRPEPIQPAAHVDPDAGPIAWFTDPPTSGPHYPIWAHWDAFPRIPPGYWVHNLEHGGVAMLYACPAGTCAPTRDALVAARDAIPTDPLCMPTDASPARVRVVITDYSPLAWPVVAVSWGWMYRADCVDAETLRQFYREHAGMAPEDACWDGYYP